MYSIISVNSFVLPHVNSVASVLNLRFGQRKEAVLYLLLHNLAAGSGRYHQVGWSRSVLIKPGASDDTMDTRLGLDEIHPGDRDE